MCAAKSLDALRREIDRIDDTIHDLLQERTEIVESVRDVKRRDRVKIRPGREDEIVYRLIARHSGRFPKRELIRIWRELIVATLSFEGPFSVAVYMGEDEGGCWDLARDHYGSFTPMYSYKSALQVIDAVQSYGATVGILPLPRRDDREPWWPHLMNTSPDAPRIIARLPFAGPGNGIETNTEALVVCPVRRTPTDRERALLGLETEEEIRPSRLDKALAEAGFGAGTAYPWREPLSRGPWLYWIEVEGFVREDDGRLAQLREILGETGLRILSLGGYGTPLKEEELTLSSQPPARPRTRRTRAKRKRSS
jgi:chorismate mutase